MRAVYQGRVIYSDWLPGLGLLTIVDHGDGYMSLYGHNERLYKAVGERVTMEICGRDREFLPVGNFVETCRKVHYREVRFSGKSHQLLLPLRVPRRIDYLGSIDDERFDILLTTYLR